MSTQPTTSPNTDGQNPQTNPKKNNASLATVIIVLFVAVLFVRFIVQKHEAHKFDLDNQHITLHLNETNQYDEVESFVEHFQNALNTVHDITSADLSISSSEFTDADVGQLFSKPLPALTTLKLNLASTKITDQGLEFVLNKIPKTVQNLDLSLDAIETVRSSGALVGKYLPQFKNLKNLRLSYILSGLKNEGGKALVQGLRSLKNIESLTLVLMGDELTGQFAESLKVYLLEAKNTLTSLSLNLFSNKFGAEGIKPIADGIEQLTKLESLEIDLYFNNLTATGTETLSNSLSKLTQLKELRLNLDFNGITNEGGEHVGRALEKLSKLEVLDIGVATKNFGYLGYKHVIEGLQTLVNLKSLNLRCGVNKVGVNGASITAEAFERLPHLQYLGINFLENYIGDEGAQILAQGIVKHLHALKVLNFDVAFNGIRGDGLTKVMNILSQRRFDELTISGSSNELRNVEAKKMVPELQKLLRRNKIFRFEFLNTAITGKGERLLIKTFQKYPNSLIVNTIELTEQERKNHPEDNVDYTEPENAGSYEEKERNSEEEERLVAQRVQGARKNAVLLRQKELEKKEEDLKKKKAREESEKQKAEVKRKEAELKAQQEQESKQKEEQEAKLTLENEAKAKAQAQAQLEAKAQAEVKAKAQAQAQTQAKAKAQAETKAKAKSQQQPKAKAKPQAQKPNQKPTASKAGAQSQQL